MQTLTFEKTTVTTMNLPRQLTSQVIPIKLKDSENASSPDEKISAPATKILVPPVVNASSHRKTQSEPTPCKRRSIFTQFWRGRRASTSSCETLAESTETERESSSPPPPPPLTTRPRSISVSAIAETPEDARLCIEFFSPPLVRSVLDDHEHFLPLDRLDQNQLLPVLPMPLRRFYVEGKSSPLQGMYPLIEPKSILRKKTVQEETDDSSNREHLSREFLRWNLTRTNRNLHPVKRISSSLHSDRSSNESSETNARLKSVSFDPRVTVTEFEDSGPRQWFSEAELDRFRTQTIMRAQAYLMEHPDMIKAYQQPYIDPVTGTLRKKALYSMPCLGSGASDESSSDASAEADVPSSNSALMSAFKARQLIAQHALEVAAKQHVQSILIVDRNQICLDLFQRSLKHVFPHARIELANSAQKALTLFRKELIERKKGFDIVIAEDAIHQPLTETATPLITGRKTLPFPTLQPGNGDKTSLHSRHDSLEGLTGHGEALEDSTQKPDKGMTGSQLLARLSREAGMLTVPSQATPQGVVRPLSNPFVPLLVSVVSSQLEETSSVQPGPADLVWGKPPPLMDRQLRDSIVERLVAKRRVATES